MIENEAKLSNYEHFLHRRRQVTTDSGFEPIFMPDFLYDFQSHLVEWSIRKGRGANFADCGLGKTPMQLVWAENVLRKTNKPVLIVTPLAVSRQTEREGDKFGIEVKRSQDGKHKNEIVVTNYERLEHFDPNDFAGCVCDESSILKNFQGATRKRITRFMNKMPYRLLCTATASPNDYVELGTSADALGVLSYSAMLKMFFKQLDDKGQKKERRQQEDAEVLLEADHNYFQKLSYRVAQTIGQWRLKHHAVEAFWRWVASWAMACRMPADLGYDNGNFVLPELHEQHHIIKPKTHPAGMLFTLPAIGLGAEREERKRTLHQRCELVASLVAHKRSAAVWCHMNAEADLLEQLIPDAAQIAGRTPDDKKIELYEAFTDKSLRVLIIKPKIGAWGLNWQHCNHVVTFATHSYEQEYQLIRRCWRFGQNLPVTVDKIATEGEVRVMANLERKQRQADAMFTLLVREMNNAHAIHQGKKDTGIMEVPKWL